MQKQRKRYKYMVRISYVLTGGVGEYTEKKSRFIGEIRPITSQEEAAAFLQETRKLHHDARHHCMAWILGDHGQTKHSSDDGEPSGTAGRPILSVMENIPLTNAALIVTRYFGGTLLGTGGLVRAYTAASQAAVEDAAIVCPAPAFTGKLTLTYSQWPLVQAFFRKQQVYVTDTQYGENVSCRIYAPAEDESLISKGLEAILKAPDPVAALSACEIAESGGVLLVFDEAGLRRIPVNNQ